MKLDAKFTLDELRHDQDNEVHLVISLTAPKKDWEENRPAVCVFPVIDISGSMSGNKLDYAKKSAIKLVEHLKPGDYSGLAVFDTEVQLISKPVEMTQENKNTLKQRIGDLHSRNSTNFSGGMLEGLKQLNESDLPNDVLLRLIMLTDGQANCGVARSYEGLCKLLEQNMGRATMSCFGYGEGANQELLSDLAEKGKGNYAFIQNPDDALSAFAKEIGGLLSTYAQNIEIEVVAKNGHSINEVISDVDTEGDDKKAIIKLPEILSEEVQNVVIKTTLSKQTKALPRKLVAFDVNVKYDFITEEGKVESKSESLKGKASFVKPGKEQTKPDQELDKVVALAELVKAQIEAEEHAKAGRYDAAYATMSLTSDSFARRGHAGHSGLAGKLGTRMRSRTAYSANQGYFKSAQNLGKRGMSTSSAHAEALDDYTNIGVAMSNDAQAQVTESFTKDEKVVTSPTRITRRTCPGHINPDDFAAQLVQEMTKKKAEEKKSSEKKTSSVSKKRSKRW
jgi:Ca-activated chloride channel homolog